MKINAKDVELFPNESVHEFYRFKALITSEQVNTSVVEKKKNLRRANINCMQMRLGMSIGLLSAMVEMMCYVD